MPTRDVDIETEIGRRLRNYRDGLRLSQQALADRAGLSSQSISNYEGGYSAPSLDTIVRLAVALDIPASAIVDRLEDRRDLPTLANVRLRRELDAILRNAPDDQVRTALAVIEALIDTGWGRGRPPAGPPRL